MEKILENVLGYCKNAVLADIQLSTDLFVCHEDWFTA